MKASKTQILKLINAHVAQRSGIDPRNYGGREYFMQDYNRILQHGKDARALLTFVSNEWKITADDLRQALLSAFSGRLELKEKDGKHYLFYCTGQYFPTEYRAAACAVLAYAIWGFIRQMPAMDTGDDIRKQARKMFGRAIAERWFN